MHPAIAAVVAVVSIAVMTSAYLVARRRRPVPFPARLAPLLSAPWRRWFSPAVAAQRHGLAPGLTALEIGPGNGYLTPAAAAAVGPTGRLVCLDIQLAMLRRLQARLGDAAPPLVCASGARLPFRAASFDRIYMSHVLGEIPNRAAALTEYASTLCGEGILAVTEGLPDPDFIRRTALIREAEASGFCAQVHYGHSFFYTQRLSLRPRAAS